MLAFPVLGIGQTDTENYVKTTSYQVETTDGISSNGEALTQNDKVEQVNYYDGLGRMKQSILVGGAGDYQNGFTDGNSGSTDTRSSQVPGFTIDWSIGQGSTDFYNHYGLEQESNRKYTPTPDGNSDIVWECINDAAAGSSDGGFLTDYFDIDNTSSYTFTVWVKKGVNLSDGGTYLGTNNVSNLAGNPNGNPYFISNKDMPNVNQWYLMVGLVHAYDYKGGDLGISGIYDAQGNKVIDGVEWKWNTNATTTRMRALLYGASNTSTRQYFWNPTLQKSDNKPTNWEFDWREGVGSTPFYNVKGSNSENKRVFGESPTGNTEILWKCDNDASNNADGGWDTDYFPIDPLKKYRYTTWVKRTGSNSGTTYHGAQLVNDLSGKGVTNPYFWSGDLPQVDEWYAIVGVIHPSNYTGGDTGESGVYDLNGNKVIDGTEFKWPTNSSRSASSLDTRMRSYFYYSTDVNTEQYFWNPTFEEVSSENENITESMHIALASGGDIITHYEYDALGRQVKNYLPYATETSSGGNIVEDPLTALNAFYDTEKYENTLNPYSETVFESSPLSRVQEQGAPGTSWLVDRTSDDDHTIKFSYQTNQENEVRFFDVGFTAGNTESPYLIEDNHYEPNQLYKNITKDENWTTSQIHDHTTEEFTDKLGRVVLKRTYDNEQPHDTYYVYDDFGNLTFVIPPLAASESGVTPTLLDNLCYQYKYDNRNRLIEKKIPGKGWEYIVYNRLDQPILTQDAILKNQGKWLVTKYDSFGRVAYTGMKILGSPRATVQSDIQNLIDFPNQYVIPITNAQNIGDSDIFYDSTGTFPNNLNEIYTVNYYDDYRFDWNYNNGLPSDPETIISHGVTATQNVKGLPTGSKIKVLDTDDWIVSVTSYDEKGRAIYGASYNEYLGTLDESFTELDFVGRPILSETQHTRSGNTITIEDIFTYDAQGRLIAQDQRIDNALTTERIVENVYDELGSLSRKRVGGEITSSTGGLQDVLYRYNVRGWLTDINDVDESIDSNYLFNFQINYDGDLQGSVGNTEKLYNGNISQTIWKTANDDSGKKAYSYIYDDLNRITQGINTKGATLNASGLNNLEGIAYDKNGNILSLQRRGFNDAGTTSGIWDNLIYTYSPLSNQLLKVDDTAAASHKDYGFKDGNNSNDYSYDVNGNMIKDENKNLTSIEYNYLNLPTRIERSNGSSGVLSYIYDATGVKLEKQIANPGGTTTTIYANNFIYKNGDLEMFSHSEGYTEPQNSLTGGYNYVYQYKDHLGNVRLTYADSDGDGSINPSSEIISEKNYYPFGLQQQGYNDVVTSNKNDVAERFMFNGKENNPELGLNWIDYGARNYDASLGRWMNIDPLAEMSFNLTPYRFAGNNPVLFQDPNGLWEFKFDEDSGTLSLNRQEGDTYDTFLEQSGLSGSQAKKLFGVSKKDLQGKLNEGGGDSFAVSDFNSKSKHGKLLQGLETALSSGNEELRGLPATPDTDENTKTNCFTCTRNLMEDGSVDSQPFVYFDPRGTATGYGFDDALNDEGYSNPRNPKLGDGVRWAKGGKAEHASIFLLNNNDGVQMFTKNGHANSQLYMIMLQSDIIKAYGEDYGIPQGRQKYEAQVPTADGGTKTEIKSDSSPYYRYNN